jgi:hypothetical protein
MFMLLFLAIGIGLLSLSGPTMIMMVSSSTLSLSHEKTRVPYYDNFVATYYDFS